MKRAVWVICALAAWVLLFPSAALAWDASYDGSVLPSDATLGTAAWIGCAINDVSRSSAHSGVFRLVDSKARETAYFYREQMLPSGTPITLETRVRVVSGTGATIDDAPAGVEVGCIDACVSLRLWPDKIKCGSSVHTVDLTTFHIIRVALQANKHYQVWLDGSQVLSGSTTTGTQAGIVFGSSKLPAGTVDCYWDYVKYTKAYTPIE